jgi:enamine deaminase RidA (YjgF/YER057c/UK114 family)
VVIEAVVATKRTLNPNGLAFVAGQTGNSFPDALRRLQESVKAAGVAPDHLLRCTCFAAYLDNYEAMRGAVQAAFPNAGINIVQALRDPPNETAMCEAVGQLSSPPAQGPVVLLQNARATQVHTPQLVFTGLQLTFGSFLDDAHEAVSRLQRAASALQAVEAPVEFNAFSIDQYAGSAIRRNVSVPPSTFTVQRIEGLPAIDASAGIEAVLAPKVADPITQPE